MFDCYENFEKFTADKIGQLRIKKDVSAREMSLSLGFGKGYITTIENHISMPSMEGFYYICEYLNISPKDFFDEETKNPILISELIEAVKDLDDDSLKALLTVAKNMKK